MFEQISNAAFTATGIRPGGLDLTQQALARSKLAAGSRVLDVGCGTGVTVEYLLYEHVIRAVGIDLSSMLVAQGKARDAALPLFVGDAGVLPFSDASFDGVLLECTLSLVRDREGVLTECHRVLKPLGRLIVTDLYARNPEAIGALRRLSLQSCLKGALNKNELIRECSVVGFELKCFEDYSDMLRDFAAQIVWTYGSLDRFWTETGATCVDLGWIRSAIREARPGYFLYVGSKAGGVSGADGKWSET
jgi:ubiquinone/menaquinone biosynthesis C-methylase UbiE